MKRIALAFCLLLFLALPVNAQEYDYCAGAGGAAASCNYSVCSAGCTLFSWDCSTTSMASNVCSLGTDTTAGAVGDVDLTTNAGKITILAAADGLDYYRFDVTGYDIIPAGAFTIEMTVNLSTCNDNGNLFSVALDASNGITISLDLAAGNDIEVLHVGNGTTEKNTFNTNLTCDGSTSYQLVFTADTTNGMDVSIDGGSTWIGVPASSTITTMTHAGTLVANAFRVGNGTTNIVKGTFDDIRVKSGWKAGY